MKEDKKRRERGGVKEENRNGGKEDKQIEEDVDDEYKRTYPHGDLEVVRHRRRSCSCRLTLCQWHRQQILWYER